MIHLHFSLPLVQFLADHRNPFLTRLCLAASFFGSANFYALVIIFLYVSWDKRFAIRVAVLILLTSALNDILKLFIRNPRPFITQGTWRQKWAVSHGTADSLATEFSTPSGHAMSSSTFYTFLAARAQSRVARLIFICAILLIGFSRPYLGVHYVEDVLIGWCFGIPIALVAARFSDRLAGRWAHIPHSAQIAVAAAASTAIFALAAALNGNRIDHQVSEVTPYCGFLTAIVVACPLECRFVCFDPNSSSATVKVLRSALAVGMMALVLFGLKAAFRLLAAEDSLIGCALNFIRYVAANITAMFLAPLIFCRMKLAASIRQ